MSGSSALVIIVIIGAAFIPTFMCDSIPSVTKVWPEVEKNLTLIRWKHAVNNKTLLDEALKSDVHMIEADVSLDESKKPIMAHPPAVTSDLTLQDFLTSVTKQDPNNKKGIKLDFKTIEAFNNSVAILKNNMANLKFPVWLNADILKGPQGEQNIPVNESNFLATAKDLLPGSTLSLGWTTKSGAMDKNTTDVYYNQQNIDEMLKVVNSKLEKNVSVTYAVRAALLVNTKMDVIEKLVKNSDNTTLTVWSANNDLVDATALSKMIMEIGLEKVYVDVPADLMEKMQLSNSANMRFSTFGLTGSILLCFVASRALMK